jgi:threonine/homoserine/homoserine lactone efflux protein
MNDVAAFLAIIGAISVGAISPGPSFLYIAQLAANRRSAALQATLGLALGGALYGTLAVWGVAGVVSSNSVAMGLLRGFGGVFMLFLGISLWINARDDLSTADSPRNSRNNLLFGFITQVSNPKTIVIYVSVYGALLPRSPAPWLYVALPVAMFAIELIWYTVVSFVISSEASRAFYLRLKLWIDRVTGVVLALVGVSLFLAIFG